MKTRQGKLALLTAVCIFGIIESAQTAHADGLPRFTGYTRPGALNEVPVPAEANKPARLEPEKTGLGATVYFRVYDLTEGVGNDPWNTGIKDFATYFVPGKDSVGTHPSRKLDTSARYLYLYQTINDSKRESDVRTTTVRLVLPPQLITSWGHLSQKEGNDIRGVGFGAILNDPDPAHKELAEKIRLASTDNPIANRKTPFEPRAPAHVAEKPFALLPMAIGNDRILRVADNGLAEDIGREPEQVMMINSAAFEGPPRNLRPDPLAAGYFGDALLGDGMYGVNRLCNCNGFYGFAGYNVGAWGGYGYPFVSRVYPPFGGFYSPAPLFAPLPVAPVAVLPVANRGLPINPVASATGGGDVALAGLGQDQGVFEGDLKHSAAIRAFWLDKPLKPGERSTIFGFTSNYPPVYEDVRLRGNPQFAIGLVALAPDLSKANLTGDGEVPTPVAFEQPAVGAVGSTIGFLGGVAPTGTTGGGAGGGLGGGAGIPGFGGSLSSGLSGGGGSNGSSNGTPSNTGSTNGSISPNGNITITNTNEQQQQQKQKQQQQQQQQQQQEQNQHQHGGGGHTHVIPEPAAIITAILGLPAAFLVARRRLKAKKTADNEPNA